MSCCVCIPVYKERPSSFEMKALEQCLKLLSNYPLCIVVPYGFDKSQYNRLLKKRHANYHFEYFDKKYFDGIKGYNHLMLSVDFYKRFLSYEYILIYQLDAYVFYDNLDYWYSKGLDYFGAPIPYGLIHDVEITHNAKHNDNIQIPHAYNGGVSLRKVNTFIKTIEENKDLISKWFSEGLNEDIIFSSLLLQACDISENEALQFCIDNFPRESVSQIGGKMPMFCHGWTKIDEENVEYDGLFWMKHIWRRRYWILRTKKRIQRKIKSCLRR